MQAGLDASPTTEVLVEESVLGWKEYEMEVIRDRADNCIIICSIENIDPMGVHTGDSITVAPALTLTDKEYQIMRNASIAVLREIGVETGGSNVQFAVNPDDGRLVVIEMNPRVSRSSALASKATGFPIAKIAAKLAVGYTLDELENDITGGATPASFEPSIDYVVTKIPRFAFEKFPGAEPVLTTAMKSVGEVMAIGRTFQESLQKALRGLETGLTGLDEIEIPGLGQGGTDDRNAVRAALGTPTPDRLRMVAQAIRMGTSLEDVHAMCKIDPWFLEQIAGILAMEARIREHGLPRDAANLRMLKGMGFSDARLASLTRREAGDVARLREKLDVHPVFKRIDTCAAEFASPTAYMYSTYETPFAGALADEAQVSDRKKVVILGGGPNRIGQGIEFDYCCCHAAFALKDAGYEAIMINCNPETVSTDYDTSDRLYFEPLTAEDVLEILRAEMASRHAARRHRAVRRPDAAEAGRRAGEGRHPDPRHLARHDRPRRGPRPLPEAAAEARADAAEERHRLFGRAGAARRRRARLPAGGAPVLCARRPRHADHPRRGAAAELPARHRARPGAGGHQAEIPQRQDRPDQHAARQEPAAVRHLSDRRHRGRRRLPVATAAPPSCRGILEHIEEAGIHSGDSACSLPVQTLSTEIVDELERQTAALARALHVGGLMNVQYAIQNGTIFVLEVNPRASRTVPFVAKTIGRPIAKIAARIMAGETLDDAFAHYGDKPDPRRPGHIAVKEAVFPFARFPGVDILLGPEMRSTGEVMGLDYDFALAFAKSQLGAGVDLPRSGTLFVSVRDDDKPGILPAVKRLAGLGFKVLATGGTARFLAEHGVKAEKINKVLEGRPHIEDAIRNRQVQIVFNTTDGQKAVSDSKSLRRATLMQKVPYYTTMSGAAAVAEAIAALKAGSLEVRPLQDYFA